MNKEAFPSSVSALILEQLINLWNQTGTQRVRIADPLPVHVLFSKKFAEIGDFVFSLLTMFCRTSGI